MNKKDFIIRSLFSAVLTMLFIAIIECWVPFKKIIFNSPTTWEEWSIGLKNINIYVVPILIFVITYNSYLKRQIKESA